MSRIFRALLAPAVLPVALAAQQPPSAPRGATVSDTVGVVVVHIRADRRAEYERWLRDVIVPAVRRAGERFPSTVAYWSDQAFQFLTPAAPTNDSTVTYMYVFDMGRINAAGVKPEPGVSEKAGWRGLFEDAGMSPGEIERQLAVYRPMERRSEFYSFVRGRLIPPR